MLTMPDDLATARRRSASAGAGGPVPSAGTRRAPCAARPWPGRRWPGRSPRGTPTTLAGQGGLCAVGGRSARATTSSCAAGPGPRPTARGGPRSRGSWGGERPGRCSGLGLRRPVVLPPAVGRDLAPDRRAVPAEPLGDGGVGLAGSIPTLISSRSETLSEPARRLRSDGIGPRLPRSDTARTVDAPIQASLAGGGGSHPRATASSARLECSVVQRLCGPRRGSGHSHQSLARTTYGPGGVERGIPVIFSAFPVAHPGDHRFGRPSKVGLRTCASIRPSGTSRSGDVRGHHLRPSREIHDTITHISQCL